MWDCTMLEINLRGITRFLEDDWGGDCDWYGELRLARGDCDWNGNRGRNGYSDLGGNRD